MRWHLVDTDKTYLQSNNIKETPTDNRDIGQSVGKHMFCNTCWDQSRQMANMLQLKSINNGRYSKWDRSFTSTSKWLEYYGLTLHHFSHGGSVIRLNLSMRDTCSQGKHFYDI